MLYTRIITGMFATELVGGNEVPRHCACRAGGKLNMIGEARLYLYERLVTVSENSNGPNLDCILVDTLNFCRREVYLIFERRENESSRSKYAIIQNRL